MKKIRSLDAPTPGLNAYLNNGVKGTKDWDGFRSHASGASYSLLIETLVEVQHGLCGYCEIDINKTDRQVEHVIPQSHTKHGTKHALDYRNMIACCKGGTLQTSDETRRLDPVKRNRSCGEAKENKMPAKFLNPRKLPALPSVIRVIFDGRILPDEAACERTGIAVDTVEKTIELLRLNCERLRRVRESHWNALSDNWGSKVDDPGMIEIAARGELLPDKDNRLPRFFTTSRSYFGDYSEKVLSENPMDWI